MSPLGEMLTSKIVDLVFEAVKTGVIQPWQARRKIEGRVRAVTSETLAPLAAYLENEKVSQAKQKRLVEECIRQLKPYTQDSSGLFQASLDGENIFKQLHPSGKLPEVIREDGLEGFYALLLPRVADLLCKLPEAVKDWESTSTKEILHRLDALAESQRQVLEKQLEDLRKTAQRIDETTQSIKKTVELIENRLPPDTLPLTPKPSLLLTSLPLRAEHFTGREKELQTLLTALQPARQVTLCAVGGMGKTALAAEALHILLGEGEKPRLAALQAQHGKLHERFSDGLFYFAFYHQKEAALCLEALCRAFGEQPLPNPLEAARRALAGKQALLVLDGTEEADDLPSVLSVCGTCGELVTTRKKKDALSGELIELKPLPEDKSLKLLKKWAGKYALDADGGTAAAQEIIALTGNLPLATAVIGKYLKHKQEVAKDYLRWLRESKLEALSQGARQRESVPLMLERSLSQVPEASCRLVSLAAALAYAPCPLDLLWAGMPELENETDKRKALDPLLEYGLLGKGAGERGQGSGFRVQGSGIRVQVAHLLLYEYVKKRHKAENERLIRMAVYGVELAEREVPKGPAGFRFLDAYRAHLLDLLKRLLDLTPQAEEQNLALSLVAELAWELYDYLELDGRWTEWLHAMQQALEAARRSGDKQWEGNWLGNLGNAYQSLGQYEKAIDDHQQALQIAREIGDRSGEGNHLGNLGVAYDSLGQYEKAIEHYQQALRIAREIGDRRGEGNHLGNLGVAYKNLGQYEKAIDYHQQALQIAQEIGDRRGEGNHLGNLGVAYGSLGQYEKAMDYYQQALEIAREIGDRKSEGAWLGNLGIAYKDLGQYEKAIEHYQQALQIAREIGDRSGEGAILGNLGNAYRSLGQYDQAIEHFQQALEIAREISDRQNEGAWLGNLGNAYKNLGQYEKAIEHYRQALQIARQIGDRQNEGTWLANLGLLHQAQGELEPAHQHWQQALQIYEEIGSPYAERVRRLLEEKDEG